MTIEIRGLTPLLSVFDMPTSVHFYRDILGFELVNHSPFYAPGEFHWAMLRHGDAELMLNTAYDEGERPNEPDAARIASHRDVVLYFGCPNVDTAYEHLVANGVSVAPPKAVRYGGLYPFKVLSVVDPDGYHLYLQWPEPGSHPVERPGSAFGNPASIHMDRAILTHREG